MAEEFVLNTNEEDFFDVDIYDKLEIEPSKSKKTLLGTFTNLNIASFITHEACRTFYNVYKDCWVPHSFIEFYFSEYERYTFMSPEYLVPFFKLYSEDDIPAIADAYYNTNYTLIRKKTNRKDEMHYLIDTNYYIENRLSHPDSLGRFDPPLYKNLNLIAEHLTKSDELVSVKETYENFMMKKIVLADLKKEKTSEPVISHHKKTNAKVERVSVKDINDTLLVGKAIDVPEQKGRVTKLFFPKLSLPSPYPVLQEKSRINSDHRATKFTPIDQQVKIINAQKFNAVKYKLGFIEKRKVASKPAKKKFEFDF